MLKTGLTPYIYNKAQECQERRSLLDHQNKTLVEGVQRVYQKIPFYRKKFMEQGLDPKTIQSVEDLKKLPFTNKQDLRQAYPFGLLATPLKKVVRIHSSSGTTGNPTLVAYSKKDLNLWAELVARTLAAAGIRAGTLVQIAYGYGLFTGGLGFEYGAERLGALAIPSAAGRPHLQLQLLKALKAHVILCTPSFATTLAETALEDHISLTDLPVAAGIFGGEFWTNALRERIESEWGILAYDTYGLSEVIGPGVAQECQYQNGLHIFEDHFIPEIIHPKTGQGLPAGEKGELVLTALTKEAMPIIRYRTGDLTKLLTQDCACGRTFYRIEKVAGRVDELIHIENNDLLPSQIESILLDFPECSDYYRILENNQFKKPTIQVEVNSNLLKKPERTNSLKSKLQSKIIKDLEVHTEIQIVAKGSLPRSEGKAHRLIHQS